MLVNMNLPNTQFVSSLEVLWYGLMIFFLALIRVGKFPSVLVSGNLVLYFEYVYCL